MLRLQVIGSAGGFPQKYSQTCGYILYIGSKLYIFDTPENTLQILMQIDVDFNQIAGIFISHMHYDHISGLMNLIYYISSYFSHSYVNLYGPEEIEEYVRFHVNIEGRDPLANIRVQQYPFIQKKQKNETDNLQNDKQSENSKKSSNSVMIKKKPILTAVPNVQLQYETCTPTVILNHKDEVVCDDTVKQLIITDELIIKVFKLHHRITSYGFYININTVKLKPEKEGKQLKDFRLLITTDTNLSLDYDTLQKYFVGKVNCLLTECTFMDNNEESATLYFHTCPKYIKHAIQLIKCEMLIINHFGRKSFPQTGQPIVSEILPDRYARFQQTTVDFELEKTYMGRPLGYIVLY